MTETRFNSPFAIIHVRFPQPVKSAQVSMLTKIPAPMGSQEVMSIVWDPVHNNVTLLIAEGLNSHRATAPGVKVCRSTNKATDVVNNFL